eukprot:TRINITY_DN18339_c0_g1_i1.p2 TRINITY_DN18339_c0_g1~~TRINITY_DN18339_c0_g1_i1.p2  ORF type:complete len:374 (-),score=102.06 TRINITY_DN18339_c0_g1_i1:61-1182(-)
MEALHTELCGLKFANPLLVAAGPPSKDGETLVAMAKGGAGGLICKTISSAGAKVPRPCMARPAQTLTGTMLNVELWSDFDPQVWIDTHYKTARTAGVPMLASVGYSAEDMENLVPRVDPLVDGFEFSCHYTDLKAIQGLARALRANTKKPIFAKLSPHGYDMLELAKTLRAEGVDGFVVMNSLGPCLAIDVETEKPLLGGEGGKGWLSGQAIRPIALYWVSVLARNFPDVPIIGVGGVATWHDAAEYFLAGASAVEVCTAAIYQGPKVFNEISTGLAQYMQRKGIKSLAELRGRGLKNLPAKSNLVPGVSSCDLTRCIACGACERVCCYGAIKVDKSGEKKWIVDPAACYGCGLCTTICPKNALTLAPRDAPK